MPVRSFPPRSTPASAALLCALLGLALPARAEREPDAIARASRKPASERAEPSAALEPRFEEGEEAESGDDASVAGAEAEEESAEPDTQAEPAADSDTEPAADSEADADADAEPAAATAPAPATTKQRSVRNTNPATKMRTAVRRERATPVRVTPPPAIPTRSVVPKIPAAATLDHVVAEGETLGAIAAKLGTKLQDLIEANPELDADHIRAGQHITIGGDRRLERHTVQPGETLTAIAKAFNVTLAELQRWNPKLNPDRIRDGLVLTVYPHAPPSRSVSVGSPSAGHLVDGRKLQPGPGYAVRATERAWGTDETVRDLMDGFARLRSSFPNTPKVWVHDLSLRGGGRIADHHSHQSGRDADIAYVQRSCGEACGFKPISTADLDARRTWALLRYWLERDELEAVFIDYRLQAPIYRAARDSGASAEQLQRWFQYPRGRGNPWGVIRHYPKHGDHMHVRFVCHASDPECKTFRPLLTHTASR